MSYYTPRDLANDIGQSVWTARRVMAEAKIKHHKGTWWRLDPEKEPELLQIAEVKRIVLEGASQSRRYGRKRIRQKSLDPIHPRLC